MKLLCLDIGSGTQDILLLDTAQVIENAVQLVLPAPTVIVAEQVRAATARAETLFLGGDTMGGGACTTAVRDHLKAGLLVFATEDAARSFDDDLDEVRSWGLRLVSADEIAHRPSGVLVEMGDVQLDELRAALALYGTSLAPDAIAVAVLDHGAAPPGESARRFRFQLLEDRLRGNNDLAALAFTATEVPARLTRMSAIVRRLAGTVPLVLMDTGAAAVLGALLDPAVASQSNHLALNLGNSHTIAFNLAGTTVLGLFEHHTSLLSGPRLTGLLEKLQSGQLRSDDVWQEGGHGALVFEGWPTDFLAATGPRRSLLGLAKMKAYFAAPFGSMMLTGCFGLAWAVSLKLPEWRAELEKALRS